MMEPSPVRLTMRPRWTRDGRVDQIAAQRPQPRQGAILVGAGEPAVTDDIRDQDRRNFPGFRHGGLSKLMKPITRRVSPRPAST